MTIWAQGVTQHCRPSRRWGVRSRRGTDLALPAPVTWASPPLPSEVHSDTSCVPGERSEGHQRGQQDGVGPRAASQGGDGGMRTWMEGPLCRAKGRKVGS